MDRQGGPMRWIIDTRVFDYLRRMGRQVLTIWTEPQIGCWGPGYEILVRIGEPKEIDKDMYKQYKVDTIEIWVHEQLMLKEPIALSMGNHVPDLPYRSFEVKGLVPRDQEL